MEIIDCFWEKRNLGCSAVEVRVASDDTFDINTFTSLQNYGYIVVKVPVGKLDFNLGLAQLGYSVVEMQMTMYVNMKNFNFEERSIKRMLPLVKYQEVCTQYDLDKLLAKITPGMFSTDRVSLDPHFGYEIGCERYKNWMKDVFNNKAAFIGNLLYEGVNVGYAMIKEGVDLRGLVGGLYSEFQDDGIGLLTPCMTPLYAKFFGGMSKKVFCPISSNNKAVWDMYEYLGFVPKQPNYVFVKHNN